MRRLYLGLVAVVLVPLAAISAAHVVAPRPAAAAAGKPNIVLVLTDDFSMNLLPYMHNVNTLLRANGMTFTNMTVTDSLCCPSRTTLFTGEFPHNHGVVDNVFTDNGGFLQYKAKNDAQKSFAITLHNAGYDTGFVGKFLNQYNPNNKADIRTGTTAAGKPIYNQPGWTFWAALGEGAYNQYNYNVVKNNSIVFHGNTDNDYATFVEGNLATQFITQSSDAHKPFMLEMATYAPHVATGKRNPSQPHSAYDYQPADQDVTKFPGIKYPVTAALNAIPTNAPQWETVLPAFDATRLAQLAENFRERVQAVQAVDRWVGRLWNQLKQRGQLSNTYFVFTSDNGLELGEHRINGKMTAFDPDINVPLIITGPGVPAGATDDHLVQNTDFAPTVDQIAGAAVPGTVDGTSLLPLLHRRNPATPVRWRTVGAIEHTRPSGSPGDPDGAATPLQNPPSYVALRGVDDPNHHAFTYVQYADGEREYYDRTVDPAEMNNIYSSLTPAYQQQLAQLVSRYESCAGASCSTAGNPQPYA